VFAARADHPRRRSRAGRLACPGQGSPGRGSREMRYKQIVRSPQRASHRDQASSVNTSRAEPPTLEQRPIGSACQRHRDSMSDRPLRGSWRPKARPIHRSRLPKTLSQTLRDANWRDVSIWQDKEVAYQPGSRSSLRCGSVSARPPAPTSVILRTGRLLPRIEMNPQILYGEDACPASSIRSPIPTGCALLNHHQGLNQMLAPRAAASPLRISWSSSWWATPHAHLF
jgi:hypothetical protein